MNADERRWVWSIASAIVLWWGCCSCVLADATTTKPTLAEDIVPNLSLPQHPRLLLSDDEVAAVRKRIKADPLLAKLYESEKDAADALLAQPLVRYEKQGRRLLAVSREALVRITRLAILHRIEPDDRYLERARAEMLAVAKFTDWNPSHFLDTAEMGAAVAIGYDWLHDDLDEPTRQILREAMIEKAIKKSFVETGGNKSHLRWIDARMNWNQVCHGGLTMAALALWEHERELAAKTVRRAVERVPRTGMTVYAPDGAYPEGPGYWEYGTMYNVLLIASLRSALGTDLGMASAPGFSATPVYQNQVAGPTLRWFNYADCRAGGETPSPYLSWFAREYKRPDFAIFERGRLERALAQGPLTDRMAGALVLMWFDPEPVRRESVRLPLSWTGRSENPVAAHRSSWTDPGATYLAVKGGSPRTSHAQMDAGTFVFDASAVRWACDLGLENYYRIESRGMSLWNNSQNSDRWKIFRQQPASHSVITINDQLQSISGMAKILSHQSDGEMPNTIVDLTPVHLAGVKRHHRGAALVNDRRFGVIGDELEGLSKDDKVAWSLITEADVTIDGARATLKRSGKTLTVIVQSPNHPRLSVTDISKSANEWDSPNPGAKKLIAQLTPDEEGKVAVTVLLATGSTDRASMKSLELPLSRWPSP